LIRIPKLVTQATNLGLNAIALTDKNNLFAAIKFYKAAKGSGIKPIFGAEITLQEEQKNSSLLLLCQDKQGYLNLSELISLSYQGGQGMEGELLPYYSHYLAGCLMGKPLSNLRDDIRAMGLESQDTQKDPETDKMKLIILKFHIFYTYFTIKKILEVNKKQNKNLKQIRIIYNLTGKL
jgi:DNA polymerase III alpha subunit